MAFDFIPPPAFDFLPRDASRRVTKSLVFLTLKPIKQYILGFNSVKLCCSNYILPFGTAKSVKSSKLSFFLFFKLLIFFPISKPFDFIPPPHRGGGNTQRYTRLVYSRYFSRLSRFLHYSSGLHFRFIFLVRNGRESTNIPC